MADETQVRFQGMAFIFGKFHGTDILSTVISGVHRIWILLPTIFPNLASLAVFFSSFFYVVNIQCIVDIMLSDIYYGRCSVMKAARFTISNLMGWMLYDECPTTSHWIIAFEFCLFLSFHLFNVLFNKLMSRILDWLSSGLI